MRSYLVDIQRDLCLIFSPFLYDLCRCGHCKSLEPEYEKAAGILKGVVKVVAVDATEGGQSLASKYGVQVLLIHS